MKFLLAEVIGVAVVNGVYKLKFAGGCEIKGGYENLISGP